MSRRVGARSASYEVGEKLGRVFLFVYLAAIGGGGEPPRKGE
jgi:hypothetical protein